MRELSLVPISYAQLPALRDLYAHKIEHIFTYNILQNYCLMLACNSAQTDVKLFSLNGDWQEDGLFLLKFGNYIHFDTLSNKSARLSKALSMLQYENSGELRIFNGYSERFHDLICDVVSENKLWTDKQLNGSYDYYILPQQRLTELAKRFVTKLFSKRQLPNCSPNANYPLNHSTHSSSRTLPNGFYLASLKRQHAALVNETWSARHDNSLQLIERYIENGTSVGVFDNHGQLVAWTMIQLVGAIGLLYVTASFRKLGFGSLLIIELSKAMHKRGLHVTATVSSTNAASRQMFTKLGFEKLSTARYNWTYIKRSPLNAS